VDSPLNVLKNAATSSSAVRSPSIVLAKAKSGKKSSEEKDKAAEPPKDIEAPKKESQQENSEEDKFSDAPLVEHGDDILSPILRERSLSGHKKELEISPEEISEMKEAERRIENEGEKNSVQRTSSKHRRKMIKETEQAITETGASPTPTSAPSYANSSVANPLEGTYMEEEDEDVLFDVDEMPRDKLFAHEKITTGFFEDIRISYGSLSISISIRRFYIILSGF